MGLLSRLVAKVMARSEVRQQPTVESPLITRIHGEHPPVTTTYQGLGFTASISVPAGPPVSDSEVADRVREYAFVLNSDPPQLKTGEQWWSEKTHKRRRSEGSDRAYDWLLPFAPLEVAKSERLQSAQEWGPHGAGALAKELRGIIREKRKSAESSEALLKALYGVCVADDLSASLKFEGSQPHFMAQFVNINELQAISIDYGTMGYQCSAALSKTDVKWLVEAFGEPIEHQSFDALWPDIRRNAISRYCWAELRRSNASANSLGWPQKTMQEWLSELVKRNIGYHKEWQERVAARQAYVAEITKVVDASWDAMMQPFVVADLETTGINAETDEVIEFAALRVEPSGMVSAQFACLVRPTKPIPEVITRLTGITQIEVERSGVSLADGMKAFIEFVGVQPVFFHNARFDEGFLRRAASVTKTKFANAVHDTLPMARSAWPSLGTYKLALLSEHLGCAAPSHRALPDATAALAVLLAARDITKRDRAS